MLDPCWPLAQCKQKQGQSRLLAQPPMLPAHTSKAQLPRLQTNRHQNSIFVLTDAQEFGQICKACQVNSITKDSWKAKPSHLFVQFTLMPTPVSSLKVSSCVSTCSHCPLSSCLRPPLAKKILQSTGLTCTSHLRRQYSNAIWETTWVRARLLSIFLCRSPVYALVNWLLKRNHTVSCKFEM